MGKISTIPPEFTDDTHAFIWHDVNMEMPPEIEVEDDDGSKVYGSAILLVSVVDPKTGFRSVVQDMTIEGHWIFNQGDWNKADDTLPIVEAWMNLPDTYYNKDNYEKINPSSIAMKNNSKETVEEKNERSSKV